MSGAVIGLIIGIAAGWFLGGMTVIAVIDYFCGGNGKHPLEKKGGG